MIFTLSYTLITIQYLLENENIPQNLCIETRLHILFYIDTICVTHLLTPLCHNE